MFCPRCGCEYVPGIEVCSDCSVDLLAGRPAPAHDDAEWQELVTVLETGDETLLAVIKPLLEAEGVPCYLQGEEVQEFVGLGRFPAGINMITGPVQVQVPREREQAARDLIAAHDVFFFVASG